MKQDYIDFKQQREIGDIISYTFKFIRENYKAYFKSIATIAWPAFLLLIAAVSYYSYTTVDSSLMITQDGSFFVGFGLLMIALLLYFAVMNVTAFHFIKSYVTNHGETNQQEIKQGVKKDLGKMFGLGAITWVLIFVGLIIFVIPGLYLSVPLSIAAAVLVFKNESIGDSISEGFHLVKDNWWMSFISIFLIWLIVYVISLIFQIPVIIYTFLRMFTMMDENSASDVNVADMFDWVYLSLTVISSAIQYVIYAITPIGIAFVYYNLNEQKYFSGAYESIENLGKND
ncbi:hypothetical protein SAMN05660776_3139 [Salegentibacter holothuriorum]|uniref:Membrane domain of glycerophosphoryl diester phosphodiesterase n=1 Tax=Salegentibacter holothuriorum TaxID=241145 RepID=A0A1T5ED28_9FLAO|nr:hypothetical protein [Salegentibacter holothuriorum]SKB81781.1 hypothetical protein SAMN05660776_3139 [Salegentibacter holothuriorum]